MKRPSMGVIIFGVIFVLIGLWWLYGAPSMYFAYRQMAPVIYKTVTTKIYETEKLIEIKKADVKPQNLTRARGELESIKQQMYEYKINYIQHKTIPLHIIIALASFLLSAWIFIYTGIAILQLKPSARKWISRSFLAGLILSILFLCSAGGTVLFITTLAERFISIIYQITGNLTSQGDKFSMLVDMFLIAPVGKLIAMLYIIYLTFMAITSIFFARPKVKEQFKR